MRRFGKGFIVTTALVASLLASGQQASAVVTWEFSEESVALGISAVSPHVERTGSVDRIWYPSLPSTAVSDCTDAGACTLVSGVGRLSSDFTAITLPNGTRRAYFVDMTPGTSAKTVSSAQCATAECLSVGTSTPIAADVAVPMTEKAWGVPDAVVTPDGKVRVYLVVSPTLTSSCPEKVRSYISNDGINFTAESGYRLEGGFVDTEILRAKTGDWLMIMSTGPGCGNGMQQLFVSSSTDGLTWSTPQAVTKNDSRRLDPTGYEVSPNVFRIYYAFNASRTGETYTLKRGTLKIATGASTSGSVSTTTAAKIGASCTTAGAKSTVMVAKKTVKVTCKKVKNKLVWSK